MIKKYKYYDFDDDDFENKNFKLISQQMINKRIFDNMFSNFENENFELTFEQ